MDRFPSIDEINNMLDEIVETIPRELFKDLNEGIVLLPEYKLHLESKFKDKLYIMGEYCKSITGRHIKIYYGSFKRVYSGVSTKVLREKLKETLFHELTHHLESLAGIRDLEMEDYRFLEKYKQNSY